MTRTKRLTVVSLFVLIAIGAMTPFVWKAGVLRWAKFSAQRKFSALSVEERRILNTVSVRVTLVPRRLDPADAEIFAIEDNVFQVPRSTASSVADDQKSMSLSYDSEFKLRVRRPFPLPHDPVLAQLGMKDEFELDSTTYKTRLDDFEIQADLPALKRHLLFVSMKPNRVPCAEEFECGDLRGFIYEYDKRDKRILVTVYFNKLDRACGLWFDNLGGLTTEDVHQYLTVLGLTRKPKETE